MKLQDSELLIFNKHYINHICKFVHNTLDMAEIPHFIHNITDFSVFIYVGLISHQSIAERSLMSHPFAKHSEMGIDLDGDAWIEIYF